MQQQGVETCSSLRRVFCGGEALPLEAQEKFFTLLDADLVNQYGPTETSIDVTFWNCKPGPQLRTVPIGRPNANNTTYVLDRNLNPVPVGVAGQLYIGGVCIGRGYLNRPCLSAERFIPDLFSKREGDRMYMTGDLARYMPDGNIEFLGRIDGQVKVRGFRIEVGEIESALASHAAITECVVVAREETSGDKRLVGYVVGRQQVSSQELREYLRERLPDYMVPGAIVQLQAMPLTASGKLDRRALPKPELGREGSEYVGPRTAVEEIVSGIWAEVLRVEKVGISDNFFELGGHSLLAMQLVSRVRNILGVEVSLRSLFTSPTVAAMATEVEQLKRSGETTPVPPLIKSDHGGDLPLSFAQQRLWFIDQLEPGNSTYNMPAAVRLSGRVNLDALHSSLNEIVRRHEVLRTSFPSSEGEPRQYIDEYSELRPEVIDLINSDEAEREQKLELILEEETRRGFDLSSGPLIRAKLIKMGEDEHVLIVVMHHIVSDGWSMEVMVREFTHLYEALSQGRESSLAELEIQYADYAVWQREWLQGEVLENQLQYWKEKLDSVAVLEMPTDRARRPMAGYSRGSESFRISAELTSKIKQLSKREGVTLFMSLLGASQALLARYSGQEDIAVGTPIAGRNHREIEGLIGLFVNTLVMRVDVGGNTTVRELLARVRETALGAYAHQDIPFEKLVEELQPERSLSHQPLFQVMIEMHNLPSDASPIAGLNISGEPMKSPSAKFELTLAMAERGDEIQGELEYATELYDGWRMRRLLEHFERVLEGMAANEQSRVMELPLLSRQEYKQLVVDWNDTAADYTKENCFHDLFERQVARTPDAVAATLADQVLTYRELNARANRLADVLIEEGVGPEVLVALLAERGVDFLIAMMGVFKAGGAYMPLDPRHPAHRIGQVLSRSEAKIVIADSRSGSLAAELIAALAGETPPALFVLEELINAPRQQENLGRDFLPNQLAYVIYTSGSTGVPKGAMVEHRGMLNHLLAKVRTLELDDKDIVGQTASQCFDISVWQFLAALLVGGRVQIYDDEITHDPASLLDQVELGEVTVLETVPSMMRAMLTEAGQRRRMPELSALRWMIPTGEALPPEVCRHWLSLYPEVPLLNAYGPTECSDDVTHCRIDDVPSDGAMRVPIGRPITNTRIYVLNDVLQPQPVGIGGELYVGGEGVGRGYLNEAGKTSESFVPAMFGTEAGERLYASGDMARYLVDGRLDYLGRIDHQVKIRGYRIELGEIEAVLNEHPAVEQVVVLAREDDPGEKRLAAYLVTNEQVDERELRKYLLRKLPDYMSPAAFIRLDEMPLTANGKIDRKSLPRPEHAGAASESVVPTTAVEEILCGIWAEVLKVEKVGVKDNFFELGGHSLLATQVVSRIRKVLGVDLALRSLFERATVRELAEAVTEELRAGGVAQSPAIVRRGREVELPLSYAQQRLWFMQELEPESWAYNIATAVRIVGALDAAAVSQSLREIARRHEVLRTSFESREGGPVQVIHDSTEVELSMVELNGLEESERERVAREIAVEVSQRSFDLKQGPVWRAALVRLGKDEHVLVVCIHHVASDGWSSGVLIKEFIELYEMFRGGAQSRLKDLEIQYADFALWQRRWLEEGVLERQMEYWRGQLSGAQTLNLRKGQATQQVSSRRAEKVPFQLTAELTSELKALSRREGVTLFMTLLAAYQIVLGRYAKQEDVVVGTDIANRNRLETEGLIGFFVNQLVLRVRLEGELSFKELLARVREVTLGADAHQDTPFEKLVEELAPARELSRTPLFEASLVLQNLPQEGGRLEGLKVVPFAIGEEIAKYTLVLRVTEGEMGLGGALSYAVNVIHRADAELLVAQLEELLSIVIGEYDQSLNVLGAKLDKLANEYRAKRKSSLKSALRTKLLTRSA